MSSLTVHIIQSVTASATLYPVIGANAIPFGLATVFVDVDHFIEYVQDTGSLDPRGVFIYCNLIEKNLDKNFLVLNIFHTVEFCTLVLMLTLVFPLLAYVLAGILFHLAVDLYHIVFTLRRPFARSFSIAEYLYRSKNGKYITSVQELVQTKNLHTDKLDNFNDWLDKWGMRETGSR
jgi:hypothetical protein